MLAIVVLGVGGLYGWFSYRPWAVVDAAQGRLQILSNRVPLQWRVARGLTELDEVSMTPTEDEWDAMKHDPVEGEEPPDAVAVLQAMSTTALGPPQPRDEARIRAVEPILARLARARMVRATNELDGSRLDDVVRWMTWRAWYADDCLAASIDALRVAQGHTLLSRQHTGEWWTESAVLRILEPHIIECAHQSVTPERLLEAAEALARLDQEREAFVVNLESHILATQHALGILEAQTRNVWVPHVHVDPMLHELELRLSTAEALADTGSLLDVSIPRDHPQWETLRIERDREIQLRIEYQLLASALTLVAGDEPDAIHPLSEEPIQHDESRVFWGHSSIDPEGLDEVVVWNPSAEPEPEPEPEAEP